METFKINGKSELIALPKGASGFSLERVILDIPLTSHSDQIRLTIGLHNSAGHSASQSIPIYALVNFSAGLKVLHARYPFVVENFIPGSLTLTLQYADPNKSFPLEWVDRGGIIEGDFV